MRQLNFWTFKPKEIQELLNDFARVFQVNDFYWDYENVWEWIEGSSIWLNSTINISREHNWKQGEYKQPIRIRIDFEGNVTDQLVDEIGQALVSQLLAEVFYGDTKYISGTKYEYIVKKKFSYYSHTDGQDK